MTIFYEKTLHNYLQMIVSEQKRYQGQQEKYDWKYKYSELEFGPIKECVFANENFSTIITFDSEEETIITKHLSVSEIKRVNELLSDVEKMLEEEDEDNDF